MNKTKYLNLINHLLVDKKVSEQETSFNSISVKLEESNSETIVFYNLVNTELANKALSDRIKGKKIGLLVLTQRPSVEIHCEFIVVSDFLEAQKIALDEIYPLRNNIKLVGVTGTNGKTTVAALGAQLSSLVGHKSLTVGTLGVCNEKGDVLINTGLTTPSFVEIRKIIAECESDIEAIFFEVSSHALIQERFYGMNFVCGAWTSFSQDHLDYHQNMQSYFEAKSILPMKKLSPNAKFYVPANELSLIETLEKAQVKFLKAPTLLERELNMKGEFFRVHFNKSNLEIALSLCEFLWNEIPNAKNLEKLIPPKGRFSPIEFDNKLVLIDYAHTPDALSNVCRAVKMTYPGQTVKIVFGCGGNRDKKKRPLMAEAIGPYISLAYITSDNPRFEEPEDIIKDILPGLTTNYVSNPDRKLMIEQAVNELKANEILIIAGKGHEDYQEIKGVKTYFSDFDIVNDIINKK